MANEQAKFLEGNLMRHVIVMSSTASIGLVAIFFVDLVDMLFISMLGKSELAAAVGYAGAILFFTTSVGIGMAITAGALVARALGEGNHEEAQKRASITMLYGVLLGISFSALVWVNLPFLVGLVGATGEAATLAVSYLRIIVPSLPFLLVGMVGGAILRAHGAARQSMMATIWSGVANAVLDPILIFGFDLELTGAAVASVVARLVAGGMVLYPIYKSYGGLIRPKLREFLGYFGTVVAIAFPAVLTQVATPVGQAYVTRAMSEYGPDAVAGMAIAGRLMPVAFGVIFALSGAIGPIIGQNFGAGDRTRVRTAFRDGIVFAGVYIVGVTVVLILTRGWIADAFGATGLSRDIVFLFAGPWALAFFFNALIFVSNAAFNNLGHPFYSTAINWGRHTIGTIPFVMVCGAFWGAEGVLIGQYAGGVFFGLGAWWLALRVIETADGGLQRKPFQRQARLLQLFNFRR